MKRVVITGATGMIGLNLINYLLKNGVEVLAIIRKNSSKKELLSKKNNLKVIECDLAELKNLKIEENNYDVFVSLAWDGTFGEIRDDVYIQLKNIEYTLDAVGLAKKLGCTKFIGAGSQAEYGRVEGVMTPFTPINPENSYGMAKSCAGKLSRILATQLGIEHIWIRILSVYGPYDNENTMIMSSIREMLENNRSPDYTKAEQIWDYLYIEDMVRAIDLIAKKGKSNSVYCIGSGKSKPLYEYIEEIKNNINKDIVLKLGEKEYAPNQVMNLSVDISDLTRDTGFVPKVDFKEGIKKTINYYKEKLNEEKN